MKPMWLYRRILQASGVILLILIGVQFIRPKLNDPPVTAEIVAPPEVKSIFRHSCYSCHSNETKLSLFDQLVPTYWIVSNDVRRARAHLNFSEIAALPEEQQRLALFDAFNQIQLGAMLVLAKNYPLRIAPYLHSLSAFQTRPLWGCRCLLPSMAPNLSTLWQPP